MDILTQFWTQFFVLFLFISFLTKDLIGYKKSNIKVSAIIELFRYSTELVVVILSGFLSWGLFEVLYVVDVSIHIILVGVLLVLWKQFTVVAMSSDKTKDTFTSKVRLWDFISILLLFFAGFFDGLIAALWK